MRFACRIVAVVVIAILAGRISAQSGVPGAASGFTSLRFPLRFEPAPPDGPSGVKFLARTGGSTLFLTSRGAVLAFQGVTLSFELAGAQAAREMSGMDPLPSKGYYFIGSQPEKWRSNVPNYAKVKYTGIYPGVDLIYYGQEGQLECDFVIEPGGQPDKIVLNFDGADQIHVDAAGDLVIEAGDGGMRMRKPRVYQPIQGARRYIEASYRMRGDHGVSFQIAQYDPRRPLVIDPVLSYSTYLGGSGNDGGLAVAVDEAGNTYVAGTIASATPPKGLGPIDNDAFVAKLNSSGTALVYIAYLGGAGNDIATGLAVDAAGNVYLAGGTGSRDFPTTPRAFQTSYAGAEAQDLFWWLPGFSGDAFIAKLSPANAVGILYSTYLGGSGADLALRLRVDSSGNAYVAGATTSANFPTTPGAFQATARGGRSGTFVAKMNPTGTALVYSTYLAGTGDAGDIAFGLAVDDGGNAYVTGVSDEGFPVTTGSFQPQLRGRWDAFVAKLNPTGTELAYATYLGGGANSQTYGFDVAVDGAGDAYVTGTTSARDFPTTPGVFRKPIPPHAQGGKVFVTKINPSGTALLYSTWFGGDNADFGLAIAVDSAGKAYVAGRTRSRRFPQTGDTLQCRYGGGETDAFLFELNAAGSGLLHSTFLGGSGDETVGSLALDAAGNVFVAGSTTSSDFPVTTGVYKTAFGGGIKSYDTDALTPVGGDAFVSKIALDTTPAMAVGCITNAASLDAAGVSPGEIVTIWGLGLGPEGGAGASLDASGRLATNIEGTQVLFDGIAAPLSYAGANQVNAVVPYGVAANPVTHVQVQYRSAQSNVVTWPVLAAHPGIFTVDASGIGQGAILNEDNSYNSASRPAARGSIIVLFGTGAGQTEPPGQDGKLAEAPLPKPLAPVDVYIYGKKAETLYAGAAPTLVAGVLQVNARVPLDVPPGDAVPVWLVVGGGLLYEGVTVAIK
ncbi:MAG TPA: SBBP repeat-containing protein [Bryobacterales bacterium]|nr:SBBP repeat-containing protein [Bryobacterales bacterium]